MARTCLARVLKLDCFNDSRLCHTVAKGLSLWQKLHSLLYAGHLQDLDHDFYKVTFRQRMITVNTRI